jgi:hypothetical protein
MKPRAFLFLGLVGLALALASATAPPAVPDELSPASHLPYIASATCGPLLESFDNPASGWFVGQDGSLLAEIAGGEYRLRIGDPGTVWFIPSPFCPRVAYRAAVDVRWAGASGNFIGLMLDLDDAEHSYLFVINTDSRVWLVFAARPGALEAVIPPTAADAIRPGGETNRLAVERAGDALHLSINGTAVGQLLAPLPAAPVAAGVVAAAYTTQSTAEARFDNFQWIEN